MSIPWLESDRIGFPSRKGALSEPNGLLAAGGALSVEWQRLTSHGRRVPTVVRGSAVLAVECRCWSWCWAIRRLG